MYRTFSFSCGISPYGFWYRINGKGWIIKKKSYMLFSERHGYKTGITIGPLYIGKLENNWNYFHGQKETP